MPPANLLHDELSPEELHRIFSACPPRSFLPPMEDARWSAALASPVMQVACVQLTEYALREIAEPLPALTNELYADFHLTGARLPFEQVYFERRRRLARAAIALLELDTTDRRVSLLGKLREIFSEESWALPAHAGGSPTGKAPMIIDLFAAETANLMAECLVVFGSIIPDSFRGEILQRLRTQFFENYVTGDFAWTGVTNNWNAVCHQGVLGAALQVEDDADLLARMFAKARTYLPNFLSGYEADGGCSEGPAYWEYGFGWYTVLNEQLETRTDNALSLFEGDAKVREIAKYGPTVLLEGGNLVNFSDGPAHARLRPSLLAYLGERQGDADCAHHARAGYHVIQESGLSIQGERCDFFYLGRLFLYAPEDTLTSDTYIQRDTYFPDLAVVVAHGRDVRGHGWDFAAKAGHNAEHHNHNDLGSFILNIDGQRFLTEIGAPEYVKAFFLPGERYTFLAARSLGHSVPVINGREQIEGRDRSSTVEEAVLRDDEVRFALDATRAYPAEAGCVQFRRAFHFDKAAGRLTVTDTLGTLPPHEVETALIAHAPITIEPGLAAITLGDLILHITPAPGTLLDRVEIHPYRTHGGEDDHIHRLVLKPATPAPEVTLGYSLALAE